MKNSYAHLQVLIILRSFIKSVVEDNTAPEMSKLMLTIIIMVILHCLHSKLHVV